MLPQQGLSAASLSAVSPAPGIMPGTEEVLCGINICGMNEYVLCKLRGLREPREEVSNQPRGEISEGLLASARPALSVEERTELGSRLKWASAHRAQGTVLGVICKVTDA